MTCDTCTQPTYERIVDRIKRNGKPEDVVMTFHTETNLAQCEDARGVR